MLELATFVSALRSDTARSELNTAILEHTMLQNICLNVTKLKGSVTKFAYKKIEIVNQTNIYTVNDHQTNMVETPYNPETINPIPPHLTRPVIRVLVIGINLPLLVIP